MDFTAAASSPSAAEPDIAAFRAELRRIRALPPYSDRPRVAAMLRPFRAVLSLPGKAACLLRALARHCGPVRRAYGVPAPRQAACLLAGRLRGVQPSEFYMFRLYRPGFRARLRRHAGFSAVFRMQHHLIQAYGAEDFPLLRNKERFASACLARGIPAVAPVAEFAGGRMLRHAARLPECDLFAKPADLMTALGASLWRHAGGGSYRDAVSGHACTAAELEALLCRMSLASPVDGRPRRMLLQPRAVNHAAMLGTLTPGGLSTVRLVTCRTPGGTIAFLPPVLRMAVAGGIVDNVVRGGIAAPVDLATGTLCGPAYRRDPATAIAFLDRHPATGHRLEGTPLPCWPEVLELGRRAHAAFPSLFFVGWDIAILDRGPVVMEGNAWWDCDLTLLAHGIALADTRFMADWNHHCRARPAGTPADRWFDAAIR